MHDVDSTGRTQPEAVTALPSKGDLLSLLTGVAGFLPAGSYA
jgi:hypothetical protein